MWKAAVKTSLKTNEELGETMRVKMKQNKKEQQVVEVKWNDKYEMMKKDTQTGY